MAISRAFELATVSRNISYNDGTNEINATVVIEDTGRKTGNAVFANTSEDVVHSFDAATYRSAKYVIVATYGTDYQTTEILLQHDGSNVQFTEYATITDNANVVTYNSDVSGSAVRLLATPDAANTSFNYTVELISI